MPMKTITKLKNSKKINRKSKPQLLWLILTQSVLSSLFVAKNTFLRDLMALKTLMEKRLEQRGLTLYFLTNNKFQSALIYCRQLTFSSMKIYKEYLDDYN